VFIKGFFEYQQEQTKMIGKLALIFISLHCVQAVVKLKLDRIEGRGLSLLKEGNF
jgi:hypothetical protein